MKLLAKTLPTLYNIHKSTPIVTRDEEERERERKKCLPTMEYIMKTRKVPYLTIQIYGCSIHIYMYMRNDGPTGPSSKHIIPIKFSVDDDRFLFVISWELVLKGMQTSIKLCYSISLCSCMWRCLWIAYALFAYSLKYVVNITFTHTI